MFPFVLTSLTCIDTPKMHLQTTQLPEQISALWGLAVEQRAQWLHGITV